MKGFNSEQYRDELAGKLKEIRKNEDFRSPEEKEVARPSIENGPHAKMKAVLDEAKETPEYLFSKEKSRFRQYKEKVIEIADEYFQDTTIAAEYVRSRDEKDKFADSKKDLSKHNRSKLVDPSRPFAEASAERLKDVVSFSSPHVDLRLAKREDSLPVEMNGRDKIFYKKSTENKYVLLNIVQPFENDARVVLAADFLNEFPEYRDFVESLPEEMNTLRSFKDERGMAVHVSDLLKEIPTDKEKIKDFFIRYIAESDTSEILDPETESFIIARPEFTHAFHSIIAQTFADEQIVPEAGLNEIGQRRQDILSRITQAYELVRKGGIALDAKTIDALVELCVEIGIRNKRWNQKNPPIVVVEGGGFMDVLEDGTISLYGASQDFGKEKDRNKTLAILQSELPDVKFVTK